MTTAYLFGNDGAIAAAKDRRAAAAAGAYASWAAEQGRCTCETAGPQMVSVGKDCAFHDPSDFPNLPLMEDDDA